jgi:hypothetical protein
MPEQQYEYLCGVDADGKTSPSVAIAFELLQRASQCDSRGSGSKKVGADNGSQPGKKVEAQRRTAESLKEGCGKKRN